MIKVIEFFESNPEATEVFEALGKLYALREAANKVIGGTTAKVIVHTKPEMPAAPQLPEPPAGMANVIVTEEMLKENTEMADAGLKVDDVIQVTKEPDLTAGESGVIPDDNNTTQ